MKTHFLPLFLFLSLTALITTTHSQTPPTFQCKTTSKCHSLIDYPSPNTTNISTIQSLFSIRNLRVLLGANNLPLNSTNLTISSGQTLKILFPCLCRNGTGISNKKPVYTVKSGDTLYHIAAEVFKGLISYQEIGKVNNITNLDEIEIGQKLWIPLPCSCDDVGGEKVVHYGHVVEPGSTLSLIASEFGTSEDVIRGVNSGVNFTNLLAGQVLDVPLRACNTSVPSNSLDYPLLVANGTYVFTANNCVKCSCNSATLQCEPSGLNSSCPAMQCAGSDNLYIGNSTTSGCNRTTCAYAGYSANGTIFTSLVTDNTCATGAPGSGSFSLTAYSSWSITLMFIHLILLVLYLH